MKHLAWRWTKAGNLHLIEWLGPKSWKNLGARVFDGYVCLRPAVILGLTEKQKTRSNGHIHEIVMVT